jgi:hypothetical protein
MTGTLKTTLIQNPSSVDVNITLGTAGQVTLSKSPVLNGSTSGTLTIAAPAVAGTNTITFPAATDTVATLAATQTLTNKTLTSPTITSAVITGTSVLTSATAQASTSGTSIDFTGIPSYVKRITVMFNGVSTSGTSAIQIQFGDAGGVENTGYSSQAFQYNSGSTTTSTTGFINSQSSTAAGTQSGAMTLVSMGSNIWLSSGNLLTSGGSIAVNAGIKTLSDTLTQLRITTVNGTDTFDAGTINIMYE